MEELLLIPRTSIEIVEEEVAVVESNNATTTKEGEYDDDDDDDAVAVVHDSALEEGDLIDNNEEVIIADDHQDGVVDVKSTGVDDEMDATDDNTIGNTDEDDNNSDVVEVAEDEKEEVLLNATQTDDADAPLSDSIDGVTLDEDNKDADKTEDINEGLENESNNDDVMPAVGEHSTAAPPSGPLPDPDDDTLDMNESSTEEEEQPSVDSDLSYEEVVVDEENESTEQQQYDVVDATVESADEGEISTDGMDESTRKNDEGDEDTALFTDEKGEESVEDGEVQQEVELKDDTNNVIEEEGEAPIVMNEDAPSSPETVQSSTEPFPDVITEDEQKINIQYDNPLPPTSSLPPSSNNKDANREFVTGLDDVDKLFESVEVPDELDVGADGSSMQDVLVGQALKIIMKKAKSLGGAIKVKFDTVATPVKKALPQLGLFGNDDDEDDTDVDAIFESLINGNEKMVTPTNLEEEEEEDAGNKLNEKLQKLKEKVKDLPLVKYEEPQKMFKFIKQKWEKAKHLFDRSFDYLLSIFEGDDEDEDDDFDLSNMNLDDIQSLVR